MTNIYSRTDVERHTNRNDLWIIIHGVVYDLTKFLEEHPGGEEVLLKLAGQDGTTCFDEVGHSEEAIQLKENYKIGQLSDTDSFLSSAGTNSTVSKASTIYSEIDSDNWVYEEPKYEKSPWLPTIVTVGIALYAAIIYYLWF